MSTNLHHFKSNIGMNEDFFIQYKIFTEKIQLQFVIQNIVWIGEQMLTES